MPRLLAVYTQQNETLGGVLTYRQTLQRACAHRGQHTNRILLTSMQALRLRCNGMSTASAGEHKGLGNSRRGLRCGEVSSPLPKSYMHRYAWKMMFLYLLDP